METKRYPLMWVTGLLFITLVLGGCGTTLPTGGTDNSANSALKSTPVLGAVKATSFMAQYKQTEHYKLGATCTLCHSFDNKYQFTLRKPRWETCTQCHTENKSPIALGSRLQHPQKELIEGVPVGTNPEMPSFKYLNMEISFSCFDCHVTDNVNHDDFLVPGSSGSYNADGTTRTHTPMDYTQFAPALTRPRCVSCHTDPAPIVYKIKVQQQEIGRMLDALRPTFENWTRIVTTMDKNDPKVVVFNNGTTYFTYVEADGSQGVHNYEYAKFLLQKCAEEWASLK
ncbi:MAG: hypothetical protein ACYCV0_00310 [Desulfitobacteriaceae bacterium]